MIIASLAIFPTSEGVSVSEYVKEAIKVIESSGLKSVSGGMNTTIEAPDLEIEDMGAKRIHIDLNVDHRLDTDATIESKLSSVDKT